MAIFPEVQPCRMHQCLTAASFEGEKLVSRKSGTSRADTGNTTSPVGMRFGCSFCLHLLKILLESVWTRDVKVINIP